LTVTKTAINRIKNDIELKFSGLFQWDTLKKTTLKEIMANIFAIFLPISKVYSRKAYLFCSIPKDN